MVSSFNLDKKKTILIAEACDNHFGSLNNAKKMVLQAKKAGADIIKFQHHIPDEEMLKKCQNQKILNLPCMIFKKIFIKTR